MLKQQIIAHVNALMTESASNCTGDECADFQVGMALVESALPFLVEWLIPYIETRSKMRISPTDEDVVELGRLISAAFEAGAILRKRG